MSEIEMTYFPSHGFRGFMLRLVMHLGDVPFTEKIIQVQDWETIKPSKSSLANYSWNDSRGIETI